MIKVSDEDIIAAYNRHSSVWVVGKELGLPGQTIHKRLAKYGLTARIPEFTEDQKKRIGDYYENTEPKDFDLGLLAAEIGKSKPNISRYARRVLGVTNLRRPHNSDTLSRLKLTHKDQWKRKPHPRGMLGKKHTEANKLVFSERGKNRSPEQRDRMSQKGVDRWKLMSKEQKAALIEKQKVSWKSGWREIGGIKNFYRSRWEANYARYLEWLRLRGEITSWEHEPETFWFEEIKRGCRSYLPDFRVVEKGKTSYHEVKGWMDPKSITKLNRMRIYYPDVKMIVIQKKEYRSIAKVMSPMLPDWESG
jgi:hypothetical protein